MCMQVLSVLTDRFFYGRWTSSVLNLVFYNVFSEEGSTLYGVEGPLFYFKNAFNNFNFAFPFALLCPLVLLLSSKRKYCKLVLAVSPIFVWLAFMSLQPHKEERSVLFDVSLATELSLLKVILHSSETQEPVFRLFFHGCCCDATCFLLMLESIPLLTPDWTCAGFSIQCTLSYAWLLHPLLTISTTSSPSGGNHMTFCLSLLRSILDLGFTIPKEQCS